MWKWQQPKRDNTEDLPELIDCETGERILWLGNSERYCSTEGEEPSDFYKQLIESAPELLEACKALVEWSMVSEEEMDDTDIGCSRTFEQMAKEGDASQEILNAQAAIAKAETK